MTREAGILDHVQEGSDDGSTAINPGPLGRDTAATSTQFSTWGLLGLRGKDCCGFCGNHP